MKTRWGAGRWILCMGLGAMAGCADSGARQAAPLPAMAATRKAPATPGAFRCSFSAVMTFAGRKIAAVGTLDYHTPRDFRLTASTPEGKLLFDARYNWAGCHNLHASVEIPDSAAGTICRDVSLALQRPELTGPMQRKNGEIVTTFIDAQLRQFTYYLDPATDRPEKTAVQLAMFDVLTIHYRRYDESGRPAEVFFERPRRFYSVDIRFERIDAPHLAGGGRAP